MDKKVIAGIAAAAVIVIGGVTIYKTAQPTPEKAIKALDLRFTGYEGNPDVADDKKSEESAFKAYSILAKYEAKKADIDQKVIKDAITSANGDYSKLNDLLTDEETFESVNTTGADSAKIENFVHHFDATKLDMDDNESDFIKNGDKITFVFSDSSTGYGDPYFKPIKIKLKVSGLKTPKNITTKQIAKLFKYDVTGINGHGSIDIELSKAAHKYGIKEWDYNFGENSDYEDGVGKLSNGDKLTIIANDSIKYALKPQYHLVDKKDVTYTVSGFGKLKDVKTGMFQKQVAKAVSLKKWKLETFNEDDNKNSYEVISNVKLVGINFNYHNSNAGKGYGYNDARIDFQGDVAGKRMNMSAGVDRGVYVKIKNGNITLGDVDDTVYAYKDTTDNTDNKYDIAIH